MSFPDLQAQAPRALPRWPQPAISKLIVIKRRRCPSSLKSSFFNAGRDLEPDEVVGRVHVCLLLICEERISHCGAPEPARKGRTNDAVLTLSLPLRKSLVLDCRD